jgi:hypothetical protein
MHHHHLLRRLVLFLLPHASTLFSISAAATGGSACNRRCSDTVVPYPFGFSGDCPILLVCDAAISNQPLLPHSTAAEAYPILSFNSSASTFIATVQPSCNRTVSSAQASLTASRTAGAGYGISDRTGLFLHGGDACRAPANGGSSCTVQADIMTRVLRTAECRGGADWTCVNALPDPAANNGGAAPSIGGGKSPFIRWQVVVASLCQDALTAVVYGDGASLGVASLDFGLAELGWWLDGTCAAAGRCAANATCRDVTTPSGAPGHRCACRGGMDGDGFAAGDGCRNAGECLIIVALQYRQSSRSSGCW